MLGCVTLYYEVAALPGNYTGHLSCILRRAKTAQPKSWDIFLHGKP